MSECFSFGINKIWHIDFFPPLLVFNCCLIRLFTQLTGIMKANNSCAAIQMVAWLYGTWKVQVALSRPQFHMVGCMLSKEISSGDMLPWLEIGEMVSVCLAFGRKKY